MEEIVKIKSSKRNATLKRITGENGENLVVVERHPEAAAYASTQVENTAKKPEKGNGKFLCADAATADALHRELNTQFAFRKHE